MARYPPMQWICRAGISQLAIAAIDIALWDLKAKYMNMPLWQVLGGSTKEVLPAYNTEVGWLYIPDDQLIGPINLDNFEIFLLFFAFFMKKYYFTQKILRKSSIRMI